MSGYALTQPVSFDLGFQSIVRGADPGAGNSFSLTLDSRWRWRLVSAVFTLTCDANAANRAVTIQNLGAGTDVVMESGIDAVVTANATQKFAAWQGLSAWNHAANTDWFFPVFPMLMDGGTVFKINVGAIQVGDTLTLIRFVFDRYKTDPGSILDTENTN